MTPPAVSPPPSRIHELPTPEGVPLHLPLATATDRVGAFAIDVGIVVAGLFVLGLFGAFVGFTGADVGMVVLLLAAFVLRNGYFAGFELLWRGRTPGKRVFGLRVMDVHGAGLSTEAILARNVTRELETFAPLVMLVAPDALWPGGSSVVRVLAAAWAVALVLLPVLNSQHRRAGDFVAGTIVVAMRDTPLNYELVREASPSARSGEYTFTAEQLALYGEHELHVLEDLLRRRPSERREATREVARRIAKKIHWDERRPITDADAFLHAFYAAQRAELEKEMLFGRRHGDKHARSGGRKRR